MGGGSSSGGLSSIFGGGGGQSFDPTTGMPFDTSNTDPSALGGAFWGNPANPAVTQEVPQAAAQNLQANSPQGNTPLPPPTGQQSGPNTPSWVQNLSSIFLGGQGSPSALAGLTGGGPMPAAPTPSQGPGWPTAQPQAPGSAAAAPGITTAAIDPYSQTGLYPQTPPATVSPQSAPVSGKTQAEIPPVEPAPAPEAAAPAAATPDTTNYPDVSGTSRESGAGPGSADVGTTGSPFQAQGNQIPQALQDLFSGNFGRFIADLLGQQGMPTNQNQAAAPPPSTDTGAATPDTGDTGTATPDKGDTGTKAAQSPLQKAAGAAQTVAGALKPKQSPVDASGTPAAATPAAPGTPTVPTAPQTPAAGPSAAPGAVPPATGTNLMGTNFFNPQTPQGRPTATATAPAVPGTPPAAAALPPAAAPTGAPGTAAPPPGGSDFAAWRDFQLRNSDPETRRMYLENQARPDVGAPGAPGAAAPAGAPRTAALPPSGGSTLAYPPGGQPTPDGGQAPTNGMPGGMTPNAPPPTPGLGALPSNQQANRLRQPGSNKTSHYEGTLTFDPSLGVGDTKFRYGSGGGQFDSLPFGTYYVHPGAVGRDGRTIGAFAGMSDSNNPHTNTVHDPVYKGSTGTSARDGVEIHPDVSGRRLITNGCIGIDRGQSNEFGRVFRAAAAKGDLMITVKPDRSVTIFRAPPAAMAGQGNATLPPPNAAPKYDPRMGRAGVVGG